MNNISDFIDNSKEYYEDTIQVAEICLNDSPSTVLFITRLTL